MASFLHLMKRILVLVLFFELHFCSGDPAWLVIGIPTIPRPNADYLNPTLKFIASQLPTSTLDPFYGQVHVVVVNHGRSTPHPAFASARRHFESHLEFSKYFHFVENSEPVREFEGREHPDKPGPRVKRQTLDLITTLESAAPFGKFLLTMEDDFRLCPHFFRTLQFLQERAAQVDPEWLSIRLSYGFVGVVMRTSDALVFANYLKKHFERRPPDHLLVEWFAGETEESRAHKQGRKHFAFRFNALEHLGYHSSLRHQKSPSYPTCYETLPEGVIFKVEAFKAQECPHDVLWPCLREEDENYIPPPDFAALGKKVPPQEHNKKKAQRVHQDPRTRPGTRLRPRLGH